MPKHEVVKGQDGRFTAVGLVNKQEVTIAGLFRRNIFFRNTFSLGPDDFKGVQARVNIQANPIEMKIGRRTIRIHGAQVK